MEMRRVVRCLIAAMLLTCPVLARQSEGQVTVSRRGDVLLRSSHAEFMLFVSYFDGLDAPSSWASDFVWLYNIGARGIRVFPNWWQPNFTCDTNTVITLDGLNTSRLQQLKNLIATAGQKGLIVEVALSRETVCGMPGIQGDPTPDKKAAYLAAVEQLARELSGYGNIIVDLQNEWNYVFPSGSYGLDQVLAIRDAYRRGDSSKILVASMDQNGDTATAVALATVHGLGAVAYHDPRWGQWVQRGAILQDLSPEDGALEREVPYLPERAPLLAGWRSDQGAIPRGCANREGAGGRDLDVSHRAEL